MTDQPDKEFRRKAEQLAAEIFASIGEPTEMVQAFTGLHEMYLALRQAGFTEYEALWLVGYIVVGGSGKGVNNDDSSD